MTVRSRTTWPSDPWCAIPPRGSSGSPHARVPKLSRSPPTARRSGTITGKAPSRSRGCSRSEEHTSELQSQSNLVCRLLLEKKKQTRQAPDLDAAIHPAPPRRDHLDALPQQPEPRHSHTPGPLSHPPPSRLPSIPNLYHAGR